MYPVTMRIIQKCFYLKGPWKFPWTYQWHGKNRRIQIVLVQPSTWKFPWTYQWHGKNRRIQIVLVHGLTNGMGKIEEFK